MVVTPHTVKYVYGVLEYLQPQKKDKNTVLIYAEIGINQIKDLAEKVVTHVLVKYLLTIGTM